MPYRYIPPQVKFAIVRLWEQNILSIQQISNACEVSTRTIYRILEIYNATGDVVRPIQGIRGRPRALHHDDIDYLLRLIQLFS